MTEELNERILTLIEKSIQLIDALMVTFAKKNPEEPDPEIFRRMGVR